MVAPAYKGVFITCYEAIRNFALMTIFYLAVIFNRELYAWAKEMPVDELFKHKSNTLMLAYGSLLYFGFLIFWCVDVYESIKHYRKKEHDLKILLEEQKHFQESTPELDRNNKQKGLNQDK
jgi:hypothetical protein